MAQQYYISNFIPGITYIENPFLCS